jgi:hypothetical protein
MTTAMEPGWQLMTRLARILLAEHRADGAGRCQVCRNEPAPCAIAELAGVGLGEAVWAVDASASGIAHDGRPSVGRYR